MTSDGMHPDPGASGPIAADSVDALRPGELFDRRYRIVKKLGEGGMGEVYAAEHTTLQKRVAIKLLRPEIVSNVEAVKRFRQEATSSSSIGHPNIIRIEDFADLPDGRIYLCMELLDGAPLNDILKSGALDQARLLNILIQTGHGLSAAHAKGIVHRDMKPENIFVTRTPDGQDIPKILDFGIAKVAGNDGQNNLTRTGTIFGTPFYMAPEQALGQQVDGRVDIYAMGVILYEVFAGSLPFRGESFMGILTQHITTEPEPIAQRAAAAGRALPPGLPEVVARAMAKDPDRRFQTMEELVQAMVGVYRVIAGSGMSAYMEAYQPPPSAMYQTPMPPAPTGPMVGPGQAATQMHGMTPHGMRPPGAMPGMSGGMPTPQPVGAAGSAVFAPVGADQSGLMQPPKKSNVGVIFAIIAVLAVVGGGVAFFVLSGKKSDSSTSGKVGEGDGTGAPAATPDASKVAAATPDAGKVAAATPDAGTVATTTPDAGTVAAATPDAGTVAAAPDAGAAKAEPIRVLLDANADGAKLYENGKVVAKLPDLVEIEPGETRTFVIKHPKFKDKTVTVDGSQTKIRFELDRKGGGGGTAGNNGTSGNGTGTGSSVKPPPEDPLKKLCREHPDDVRCGLED